VETTAFELAEHQIGERRKKMNTENNQQSPAIATRGGVASDDKSKGAEFGDWQDSAEGNDVAASEPAPVVSSHVATDRGGTAHDDRAKEFEVFDEPKA